jgi:hypothetical protein
MSYSLDWGSHAWSIKASLDKNAAGRGEKTGMAMEQDSQEPYWGSHGEGSARDIIDSKGDSGYSCCSNLIWGTASENSDGGRDSENQLLQQQTAREQEQNSHFTDIPFPPKMESAVQAVILSRLRTACGIEGDQPSAYMM